jgi:hypothetical protein
MKMILLYVDLFVEKRKERGEERRNIAINTQQIDIVNEDMSSICDLIGWGGGR